MSQQHVTMPPTVYQGQKGHKQTQVSVITNVVAAMHRLGMLFIQPNSQASSFCYFDKPCTNICHNHQSCQHVPSNSSQSRPTAWHVASSQKLT